MFNKFAKKAHDSFFNHRFEIPFGIKYFSYKDFDNLKAKPFEFKNKNNYILRGYFYSQTKKKIYDDKLIIFCHGMGGGHQAYMMEINYLCQNGFEVVSFDYQGTILSEGNSINCFLQNVSDIDDCIDYLNSLEKYEKATKYIVGHSWGGFGASSVLSNHKDIKKLVMISGLISVQSAFNQYVPFFVSFLKKPMLKIEYDKYPQYFLVNAITNLNNRLDVKALIIQSKDDKIVSYKNNFLKMEKEIKNNNVLFLSVNNKNHNPQYTIESVNLLTNYLKKLNKIKSIEDKNKTADSTNFHKLCELDDNIMKQIVDFLNS